MSQTTVAPPLRAARDNAIAELDYRLENGMIPENNYRFLRHLIEKADDETEVRDIIAMGTYYKRTGLHYDSKLETQNDRRIRYLKKNDELSFDNGGKQHQLIIGDNYPALQNLLVSHRGKIDVIYIDPPYGCNDMNEAAKTNYTNNLSRDVLLSQLHPRLMLAKDLLTDEGVIFCSIDDKNQAYLKCLMDEVFGERNFIANLIFSSNSSKNQSRYVSVSYDYCLLYAKDIDQTPKDWTVKKRHADEYVAQARKLLKSGMSEEEISKELCILTGTYPRFRGFKNYENVDEKGVFAKKDLTVPGKADSYDLLHPETHKPCRKTATRAWVSKDTVEELMEKGRVWFGEDESITPRRKDYLEDSLCSVPSAMIIADTRDENALSALSLEFPFPKPVDVIKYFVSMYPKKDIVILDFYAGSGTTGQAVLDLNREDGGKRTFILATNNEDNIAYDTTSERMKRVMTGEGYHGENDFAWLKDHEPYGDSLAVYDVVEDGVLANTTDIENSPFNLIDETCYGLAPFENIQDKIKWICENFEGTCSFLTNEEGK